MKIRMIKIAVLLLMTQGLLAQVPGYQGKRLSIFYNACAFPAIAGPRYSIDFENLTKIGINLINDFSVDYTMSRNGALGADYKLTYSAAEGSLYQEFNPDVNVYSGNYYSSPQDRKYFINFHTSWYGLYYKGFSYQGKGAIAPVGSYNKIEVAVGFPKADTSKAIGTNANDAMAFHALNLDRAKPALAFIYTHGIQQLITNRIFFNTGVSLGFVPDGVVFVPLAGDIQPNDLSNYTNTKLFNRIIHGRMAGAMMFTMNIGLGVLLF